MIHHPFDSSDLELYGSSQEPEWFIASTKQEPVRLGTGAPLRPKRPNTKRKQ